MRFARLRSALEVIERKASGHTVVAFDPYDGDERGPVRRTTRRSSRGRQRPTPRGRRTIREDEEDIEDIVSTSRRRAMRGADMAGDKIEIEVGAVKAFAHHYSIVRGASWMVGLALLLWWIPVLGPATVGYIGGRKSGGPVRAAIASLIPIMAAFFIISMLTNSSTFVPLVIKHFITVGYQAILGALPFDFPIMAYILSNLAAIMNSGPDTLFTVLAFAVVGGAVTRMKIQERSVPPITARVRRGQPERETYRVSTHERELEDLADRMSDLLDRADHERAPTAKARHRSGSDAFAAAEAPRSGWFHRRKAQARYSDLVARAEDQQAWGLDRSARHVVSSFLATTPPSRNDRGMKAVRSAAVDLDLPTSIAFAAPGRGFVEEGVLGGHHYRPSKLYHIYGSSVNPVTRAKLEKRLRRTHTIHTMRKGARTISEHTKREGTEDDAPAVHLVSELELDPHKPRSLESVALAHDFHYDAMEHLENARLGPAYGKAGHGPEAVDELGGLIAHIGEGGEAVVDEAAVREADFRGAPVFDHHGRQRARIGADEGEPVPVVHTAKAEAKKEAKGAHTSTIVREAIAEVEARTGRSATGEGDAHKSKIAQSADRLELSPAQRVKLEKWLKHTMAASDIEKDKRHGRSSAAAMEALAAPDLVKHEAPTEEKKSAKATPNPAKPVEEAAKPPAHRKNPTAPAFEITHGSTEVDEELAASDDEAAPQKRSRSARDILNEIRLQKRAEEEGNAHVEVAKAARHAKEEADEIERHIRDGTRAARVVAMSAHESGQKEDETVAEPLTRAAPARQRHRSEDFEPVTRPTDLRGADLELTLAPVRDEEVPAQEGGHMHITEIGEAPPLHASMEDASPLGAAGIPMVGDAQSKVSISDAVKAAAESASAEEVEERHVKPSDVVLAGPSTDEIRADPSEGIITAGEADRIKKRLEEHWNRL